MTQPRRSLGRGLDALLGGPGPRDATEAPTSAPPGLPGAAIEVDIDLVSANPEQPRTHFQPEQLRELADSIREHGILQPLVVTRDPVGGGYRLIAGERRLQAGRLAGLSTVPVVVRETTDVGLLELALVENIQRADLNPIEEAMAFRRLVDEYGLTQDDVARRVGRSRTTVANSLRLLSLEPEIRRSLVAGEVSEGHARALLGIPAGRERLGAWQAVVQRGLNVRETEALVRRTIAEPSPPPPADDRRQGGRNAVYGDLEDRLRRALSTRVTVRPQRAGARITIDCYSREELEGVLAAILGEDYDR